MIDIGTIIKDVRQWNESVRVSFKKALDSLQGTRREIGSKLHAIDVPSLRPGTNQHFRYKAIRNGDTSGALVHA